MKENPLLKLQYFGQSVWMDYIRRHMIALGRTQTIDRRGRASRGDIKPFDLREGHCGQS